MHTQTKRKIHSILNQFEVWFNRTFNTSQIRLQHDCISTKNNFLQVGCQYLLKERFLPPQIVLIKKISLQENYLAICTYINEDHRSCTLYIILDEEYMAGEWRLFDYVPSTDQQIAEELWRKIASSNRIEKDEELFFIDFN